MKRRYVIKNLSITLGGLVSLPVWASNGSLHTIGSVASPSDSNEILLAEIVETVIPQTTTPGAKSLKIHQLVRRMVNDCYAVEAHNTLNQGLVKTDEWAIQLYLKSFIDCDVKQRTDVFAKMEDSTDMATKQFTQMIKHLTILGYTNSEYYMTNILQYQMAPGFYHGCVPVTK